MGRKYQYWDAVTHNAIAAFDGNRRYRRGDQDIIRLSMDAPPPFNDSNRGSNSRDGEVPTNDDIRTNNNDDALTNNNSGTQNEDTNLKDVLSLAPFDNVANILGLNDFSHLDFIYLRCRYRLHAMQITRSIKDIHAALDALTRKQKKSIQSQNQAQQQKEDTQLSKRQQKRKERELTRIKQVEKKLARNAERKHYKQQPILFQQVVKAVTNAQSNLKSFNPSNIFMELWKIVHEKIPSLKPLIELQKQYHDTFGNDAEQFKHFSFPEYEQFWSVRDSRKCNLSNPFLVSPDEIRNLMHYRSIAATYGDYPSSEKHQNERYRRYSKMLGKLQFEIYDDIDIVTLSARSAYSFNKKMESLQKNAPRGVTIERIMAAKLRSLSADTNCFGLDKNGNVLYVIIRKGISPSDQQHVLHALFEVLSNFPNQRPSPKDQRHKHADRSTVNVYHMIDWCPQGHPTKKTASRQTIANGKVMAVDSIIRLTMSLKNIREEMSAIMEVIDPNMFQVLRKVVDEGTETYKRLLRACTNDVFLGTVWNTDCVANHRDWMDALYGLSGMTCFGSFVGGDLCLPDLGIKIPYTPDTICLIATQALEHFISNFVGVRFGMVHCCHWSRVRDKIEVAQWLDEDDNIIQAQ